MTPDREQQIFEEHKELQMEFKALKKYVETHLGNLVDAVNKLTTVLLGDGVDQEKSVTWRLKENERIASENSEHIMTVNDRVTKAEESFDALSGKMGRMEVRILKAIKEAIDEHAKADDARRDPWKRLGFEILKQVAGLVIGVIVLGIGISWAIAQGLISF